MLVQMLSRNGSLTSKALRHCPCHSKHQIVSQAMLAVRRYSDQRAVSLSYDVHEPKQSTASGSHPILFLHGLYGSRKNWESLGKRMAFELSRTIVTIDARNHGQSSHSSTMSYEAMANDVLTLMELDLMIDRCDLVGHSMGGRTAMALAMSHPEALNKLVVVDVSHIPVKLSDDVTQAADYVQIMRDAKLDNSVSLSQTKRDLGTQLQTAIPNVGVRNFLLTNLVQEEGRLRWRVNLDALEANMEHLRRLHLPPGASFTGDTLFVGGANSTYLRPEDYPEIKTFFPNASFASIEGAGHWVHSEKPAEFLNAILPFLRDSS
ncbi:protein ABHD11 [Strongylocentrotus purpuratus]|uniref:sn-1-specific diacylglycerol lipase ABHD11 n=1 Tax=Strongylocentrotus purpuratus TaxID=7668 RepID=A0A7M7T1W5_STRPU|nr:protein ABHD11 [Strongylocentrotus purpuratus]XP_030847830.1 protein ABHD11 [Strongylocentrotus purpuratus]